MHIERFSAVVMVFSAEAVVFPGPFEFSFFGGLFVPAVHLTSPRLNCPLVSHWVYLIIVEKSLRQPVVPHSFPFSGFPDRNFLVHNFHLGFPSLDILLGLSHIILGSLHN
jgi:hypothetical protein